jgi:DNA primase
LPYKVDPDHPYLTERGLSKETVEYFGLGYCSRGILKGRLAIPIHNDKGELVAYAGRWPGDPPEGEGKYKLPPGLQKHLVLFNFHRAVKETPEGKLIVVEGFFDCFKVGQAGFKNVVGLMGSVVSKEQEDLLVNHAKAVVLMLDQDDAGQKARQDILTRLSKRLFIRIIELASEKDQPDNLRGEDLARLLRDI